MDVFDLLKAEAKHLGFSHSGWASLEKPPHFIQFQNWLTGGYHADMTYLARPDTLVKREHPQSLMVGGRSVLCLAFPYPMDVDRFTSSKAEYGSIAAYACLPDYHGWLAARVEQLAQRVNSRLKERFQYRVFTDSAPVLERDLAWKAGLGWIGRNGCLIHPEYGSAFLLAELVTDLNLSPESEPVADHCGNCRRCLDACPTGCIREDGTIDARRCISYLTIEHRGHIPLYLLPAIRSHVFGCDDCQTCCPWVKKTNRSTHLTIEPQALTGQIDVASELELTEIAFKSRYGGYPITRARWEGYIRNLAIVAGTQGNVRAIDALTVLLRNSQSAVIRRAAAWALGQIAPASIRVIFDAHSCQETDPEVQIVIWEVLKRLH